MGYSPMRPSAKGERLLINSLAGPTAPVLFPDQHGPDNGTHEYSPRCVACNAKGRPSTEAALGMSLMQAQLHALRLLREGRVEEIGYLLNKENR